MKKLIGVLLFAMISSTAYAHYISDRWEAHVGDKSCFVGIESGIAYLVTEFKRQSHDLNITAYFITRHPDIPDPLAHIPGLETGPIVLQIQIISHMFRREDGAQLSDVHIKLNNRKILLTLDPHSGDESMPVFVLGGDNASRAWTAVTSQEKLFVGLTANQSENLSVEIEPVQINVAEVMFDACVNEVRENGRK